jgi:hypothetical protein
MTNKNRMVSMEGLSPRLRAELTSNLQAFLLVGYDTQGAPIVCEYAPSQVHRDGLARRWEALKFATEDHKKGLFGIQDDEDD